MENIIKGLFAVALSLFVMTSCYDDQEVDSYGKVEQIASMEGVFAVIADTASVTNPQITKITEALNAKTGFSNIADLAPIGDNIAVSFGKERGIIVGELAMAISDHLDKSNTLISLGVQLLGRHDFGMIPKITNNESAVNATPALYEAMLANPAAKAEIDRMTALLLGRKYSDIFVFP